MEVASYARRLGFRLCLLPHKGVSATRSWCQIALRSREERRIDRAATRAVARKVSHPFGGQNGSNELRWEGR
jgi:hypothetical protein